MTPEDIEKIADVLIEKIHEKKHTFWVDPDICRAPAGALQISFVGLAIIGAVALAGYGAFKELIK